MIASIETAADDNFRTSLPILEKNMPNLLFLIKWQNLKLSSAAIYRWRFKG